MSIVRILVLFKAIIFACLGSSCRHTPEYSSTKIVGGRKVPHDSPLNHYLVKIDTCTGTLVSKKWILTAGHCVTEETGVVKDQITIEFPSHGIIKSKHIVLHPKYSKDSNTDPHDIALVKLFDPAPSSFLPVTLVSSQSIRPRMKVLLAGFGSKGELVGMAKANVVHKMAQFAQSHPSDSAEKFLADYQQRITDLQTAEKLLKTETENFDYNNETQSNSISDVVLDLMVYKIKEGNFRALLEDYYSNFKADEQVKDSFNDYVKIYNAYYSSSKELRETSTTIYALKRNFIIYKSENKINSACNGDSGGPMFMKDNDKLVQIGITYGINFEDHLSLTKCKRSGLYMNLQKYTNFIKTTITSN